MTPQTDITERYSRLKHPVHKIKAESPAALFEIMPGLRRYFQKLEVRGRERNQSIYGGPRGLVKIITYIVLLYDPESDLVDEYADDYRLRKETAARDAGFKRNSDGEWDDLVTSIINFENPEVLDWILDYFKVTKSHVWREICFLEEELDRNYRIRATDYEKAIKLKLDEESKRKIEELKQLKKQFYAEHGDLRKATEDELFPITAENVYKELKVPEDVYRVRQTTDPDVPKPTGLSEDNNT